MEIKFYGAFDALVDFHTAVNIIVQGTLYTRDRLPSTFDIAVQSRYFKMSLWPVWKSKFYGAFVLNRRVVLHAIDAMPARWRGDAGSSPLDRGTRRTG